MTKSLHALNWANFTTSTSCCQGNLKEMLHYTSEDKPDRGHWAALFKYNGLYEHFDSYGLMPDSELKCIGEKKNRQLNQDEPYLTRLLKKEEEKYI